jgi:hypothetical protein
MSDMSNVIQMGMRAESWCALFVIATSTPDAVAHHDIPTRGGARWAAADRELSRV